MISDESFDYVIDRLRYITEVEKYNELLEFKLEKALEELEQLKKTLN